MYSSFAVDRHIILVTVVGILTGILGGIIGVNFKKTVKHKYKRI